MNDAQKQSYLLEYVQDVYALNGAMGQGQREASGYENVMGNLKQSWTNFLSGLGEAALPIAVGLMEKLGNWINNIDTEALVNGFVTVGGYLRDIFGPAIQLTIDTIQLLWNKFKDIGGVEAVKTAFGEVKTMLDELDFAKVGEDLAAFTEKWAPLIAAIGTIAAAYGLYSLALGIKSGIETIAIVSMYAMSTAGTVLAGVMTLLSSPIVLAVLAIAALVAIGVLLWQTWDTIKAKLGELKEKFLADWEELKNIVGTAMTTLKDNALADFEELKNLGGQAVSTLKTAAIEDFEELKTIGSSAFETLKTAAVSDANELKTGATGIFETLKSAAIADFTELKTGAINKFNELKTSAMSKFNEMKTSIVSKAQEMKTSAVNKFQELKSGATEKISGAVSAVKSKFSEVFSAISTPINKARDAVRTAIDKIKGFMNFSWSLPKLKMPSFSVSGKFGLNPPQVPKMNMSWHKSGAIVKGTNGGTVVGMGEDGGDEAILPLSNKSRMKPFASAVASMMPDKGSNDSGGGDTIITGNTFHIREEADIKKVAVALQKLDKKNRRPKGKE